MSDSLYLRQKRETNPAHLDGHHEPGRELVRRLRLVDVLQPLPVRRRDPEATMVAFCSLLLVIVGLLLVVQIALGP